MNKMYRQSKVGYQFRSSHKEEKSYNTGIKQALVIEYHNIKYNKVENDITTYS